MLTLSRPAAPDAGELIDHLPEVPEDAMPPAVRSVFTDYRHTLRVAGVDLLFRVLGNYPAFLQNAWALSKTYCESSLLESHAAQLRERAVLRFRPPGYSEAAMLRAAGLSEDEIAGARTWNSAQTRILPKLLLFAAAWDAALSGLAVGNLRRPPEPRTLRLTRPSEEAYALPLLEPAHVSERLQDIFRRIREVHGYPVMHDYYRGLAQWPDYLERVWADIRAAAMTCEYTARGEELWWLARASAQGMPCALPTGADWLLRVEIPVVQVLEIRSILDLFAHRILPDVLLDATTARLVQEEYAGAVRPPAHTAGERYKLHLIA